jgi:hypothetical protein
MARPFNSQWPPEERAAYDAVFSEACTRETTSESVGYLQKVVTATAEKGELWAVWTLDSAVSRGLAVQYRAFGKAQSGNEKFPVRFERRGDFGAEGWRHESAHRRRQRSVSTGSFRGHDACPTQLLDR